MVPACAIDLFNGRFLTFAFILFDVRVNCLLKLTVNNTKTLRFIWKRSILPKLCNFLFCKQKI